MSRVFHRSLKEKFPEAVAGDGVYLIDRDGKRYFDGSGGAAVSCLGHGDADVIAAIQDQAQKLAFAHTGFFTSQPAEQLADLLSSKAAWPVGGVYFVSGGSEAMETALKMARQYFLEGDQPERCKFIARKQSYHGNSLGALAVGGNELRRAPYQPMLIDVAHIEPCYAYRHQQPDESEEAYGLRAANALEAEILRLGPESVAGFIAETVVGATAGVVPPARGYFKRIREICDKYGVLLILDEVMCGMGRTGFYHACEEDGITPDLMTIAKGLAGGYQPIGAVLVNETVFDRFKTGSGVFQHGHTYIGHPIACRAALAVQTKIIERGLLDNVIKQGEYLDRVLRERFSEHPHIGDLRGRGLFRGIELVADRESKAPFAAAKKLHNKVKHHGMKNGLVFYPGNGCVDGVNGDHILLAPPFIVSNEDVEELARRVHLSIDGALAEMG